MRNAITTPKIKREDLRLAFFPSSKESNKARSLFREDKEFEKIPKHEPPTPLSFITTVEAISLLKKKGVKFFRVAEPIAEEDITRQQRKLLEVKRAFWIGSYFLELGEVTFFVERIHLVLEKGNLHVKTH